MIGGLYTYSGYMLSAEEYLSMRKTEEDFNKVQNGTKVDEEIASSDASTMTLKECMLSSENLLHGMWLSIHYLRFGFMLAGLNTWLSDITKGDNELGMMINVFLTLQSGTSGVMSNVHVFIPICGICGIKCRLAPCLLCVLCFFQ